MAEYTCLCLDCGRVFTLRGATEADIYRASCPNCGSMRITLLPEGTGACTSG